MAGIANYVAYEAPAAGASAAATRAARDSHNLIVQTEQARTELRAKVAGLPFEGSWALHLPAVAELVLNHVTAGDDMLDRAVGAHYFSETAWDRWIAAVLQLVRPAGGAIALPLLQKTVEKAVATAPDAVKQALVAHAADLEACQPEPLLIPASDATAAEASACALANKRRADRAWFREELTFRRVVGGAGQRLGGVARLMASLGPHMLLTQRDEPSFMRTLKLLKSAADEEAGAAEDDSLEADEVAAAVGRMLRQTAPPAELARFTTEPGGVEARGALRGAAKAWAGAARLGAAGALQRESAALAEWFSTATTCYDVVNAMMGGTLAGAPFPVPDVEAHRMASDAAARLGIIRAGEAFGVAALASLAERTKYLGGVLRTSPYAAMPVADRVDQVVDKALEAQRQERARASTSEVRVATGKASDDAPVAAGKGVIPKHFAAHIEPEKMARDYLELKRAVLAAVSAGGESASLNALQIAATGCIPGAGGAPARTLWAPMMRLYAEGAVRGIDVGVVDPDLAVLGPLCRNEWGLMLGRAAASAFTTAGGGVPPNLKGHQLQEVQALLGKADWRTLDFGRIYRATRDRLHPGRNTEGGVSVPYESELDITQALEVAEPVLTVLGFAGGVADEGSLPWVLTKVLNTWKLHGGANCPQAARDKLARKGRKFIRRVLKRFGEVHAEFCRAKDIRSTQPRYDTKAPQYAIVAFERHETLLAGSASVQSYIEYCAGSSGGGRRVHEGDDDGGVTSDTDGGLVTLKRAGGAQRRPKGKDKDVPVTKGRAAANGKSCKLKWGNGGETTVCIDGQWVGGVYDWFQVQARSPHDRDACVAGMIGACFGPEAEAALCKRHGRPDCQGGWRHEWGEGPRLRACRVGAKRQAAAQAGRAAKRARVAEGDGALEEDDEDDADDADGGGGGGGGADGGGDGDDDAAGGGAAAPGASGGPSRGGGKGSPGKGAGAKGKGKSQSKGKGYGKGKGKPGGKGKAAGAVHWAWHADGVDAGDGAERDCGGGAAVTRRAAAVEDAPGGGALAVAQKPQGGVRAAHSRVQPLSPAVNATPAACGPVEVPPSLLPQPAAAADAPAGGMALEAQTSQGGVAIPDSAAAAQAQPGPHGGPSHAGERRAEAGGGADEAARLAPALQLEWPQSLAPQTAERLRGRGGRGEISMPLLLEMCSSADPRLRPDALLVGDRRGRVRWAFSQQGLKAVSIDVLPSECEHDGLHCRGDADGLRLLQRSVSIAVTMLPCEQQTVSLGLAMAAVKAIDGRMFQGCIEVIKLYCMRAEALIAEQPDVYLIDFWDAPHMETDPTEWGSDDQKRTLLFVRGALPLRPPHARREGSLAWHRRRPGGAVAQAHHRDATPAGLAEGLAEQLRPDARGWAMQQPDFEVERERFAAAWYRAGLPVPLWYDAPSSRPVDPGARDYLRSRGAGDGRRVGDGVVPRLLGGAGGVGASDAEHDARVRERLAGVSVPVVTARGLRLAAEASALRVREHAAAARSSGTAVQTVQLDGVGAGALAVLPASGVGAEMRFLFPAGEANLVLGRCSDVAAGRTSMERKAGTAEAERILLPIFGPTASEADGCGVRCAPVTWLELGEHTVCVLVAWVPMAVFCAARVAAALSALGLVWTHAAHVRGAVSRRLVAAVRRAAELLHGPQPEGVEGRTGAGGAAPTVGGSARGAKPIDMERQEALHRRDMAKLEELLLQAAEAEPHIASLLRDWARKLQEPGVVQAPAAVRRQCALWPDLEAFADRPFERRCTIPETAPMPQRWPPPRWPVHVPRPSSAIATFDPRWRGEVQAQVEAVQAWNAKAVAGDVSGRPRPRSWSNEARLPWLRHLDLDFRSGKCVLLGAAGPATGSRLSKPAALWLWRDYPHRRLLSYIVHGVRLADSLERDTTIAANLFSLYDVTGGPDAVADEIHALKQRGWLASSAGCGGDSAGNLGPARLLTSPARINPRGAVPRKDLGPPRGVAEHGHPRQEELTRDAGSLVDSLNNSSGKRRGVGGPDREAFPLDEQKPRAHDACVGLLILALLAGELEVVLMLLLFDFKYFFHVLVYEMAEIWKLGLAVPARAGEGGAHKRLLDIILELVMAMGWTRASLIAQDLANACVWRLERDFDAASSGYVEEMCAASAGFAALWARRLRIAHDDYGTHARLAAALQYTDDLLAGACGPVAMLHVLVCFCRLIGPELHLGGDAAAAAVGTARRHALLRRGQAVPPTLRERGGDVRALARSQAPEPGEVLVAAGRVGPLGNPFCGPDARRASVGFACLLACGRDNVDVAGVARLRGLDVHATQAACTAAHLWAWVDWLVAEAETSRLAVRCACNNAVLGPPCRCHAVVLVDHVRQQRELAAETARGPPPDPVEVLEPEAVQGLNLEAARPHKWHLGGPCVWIGVGFCPLALVSWVPQEKAARLLLVLHSVLEGVCDVATYRSFVGALQDALMATGGGQYRNKGLHVPLLDGNEAEAGPNATVVVRPQMRARLTNWRTVLAGCPGASLLAAVGPAPRATGAVLWEISGDAAAENERRQQREGLGGYFYSLWWNVPLAAVPGLAELFITCLELIETGLGVVIVAPLLPSSANVDIVSDAMAAYLTLRARRPDGAPARDAKAAALIAVHELIMARPEWQLLHAEPGRTRVRQAYGETRVLDDAASRGHVGVIHDVCSAAGIVPRKLEVLPARALEYLAQAVDAARAAMAEAEEERPSAAAKRRRVAAATGGALDAARADPVVDRGPMPWGNEVLRFMDSFLGALRDLDAPRDFADALARAVQDSEDRECAAERRDAATAAADRHGELARAAQGALAQALEVRRGATTTSGAGDAAEAAAMQALRRAPPPRAVGLRACERADATEEQGWRDARALQALAPSPSHAAPTPASVAVVTAEEIGQASAPTRQPIRAMVRGALRGGAEGGAATPAKARKVDTDGMDEVRGLLAMRAVSEARANEDGLGVLGASDEALQQLMVAAQRALDRRFAASTRKKDRSYWRFWVKWCEFLGTPPLRSNEAANRGLIPHLHRREQAIALGALLAWVEENPQYLVDSMFARLKGVARRHKALGITFVSLQLVAMAADGLVQEHIDVHGAESLLPKSKEPFEFGEIVAMLSLPVGTRIVASGVVVEVGDNLDWQGVVVKIHFFCTSGVRKEGIALGDKEEVGPRKFTLAQLTYRFGGTVQRVPSRHQLLAVLRGEVSCIVYTTPVPCKNDPRGTKYGNQPIPSRYSEGRTICFAREVIKYELMRGVPQSDRNKEPLILAPVGATAGVASDRGAAPGRRAWRKGGLDAFFKAHAGLVVSPARLKSLTVHSWRVWLACALLAAGATPEQIMLLLRWSSDEARKLYARMSEGAHLAHLEMACDARVDSIRSHTLLHASTEAAAGAHAEAGGAGAGAHGAIFMASDGESLLAAPAPGASVCDAALAAEVRAAAEAVRTAEELLRAAHEHRGALPPASDLPPLDDDAAVARVAERVSALRAAAATADKAVAAASKEDAELQSCSDSE